MTVAEVKDIEHRVAAAVLAAQHISVADAEALVNAINHQETMAPFLDPTWYVRGGGDLTRYALGATRAFLEFRRALEEIERRFGPEARVRVLRRMVEDAGGVR